MTRAPSTGGKRVHRISIGELCVSRDPIIIQTLLGSCVSACLFDPVARIGGMNHIFLPGDHDLARCDRSARFGINAMELLINGIMSRGGQRHRLRAKIFGGAQILRPSAPKAATGPKNIRFVDSFLEKETIPILARDVGGSHTRILYFHTDTGEVLLRRVRHPQAVAVVEAECRLEQALRARMTGDSEATSSS